MSEWMPIETAPKDGSLLLLSTDKGVVVIGKRNKHLHIWVERDGRETPRQITYWMPLPPPPGDGVQASVKPGDCIHCGKELCNDLGWCNDFKSAEPSKA